MRRLLPAVEEAILRRALNGATYREMACEFEVSLSTVNRVIEDARKNVADFDELRELGLLLRKHRLSVFDAARGAKLAESLSKYGINMQELEGYVRLNERFLSEKGLEDDFLAYGMKLMALEQACGKPYQEIVEDFKRKQGEIAELENRKANIGKEIRVLRAEEKRREEHLAEVDSELQKATIVRDGLANIGVDRLARLVKFVDEFESLGYDVRALQRLARTLKELGKLDIEPDKLQRFVAEKGPLEAQLTASKLANERLKNENAALTQCNRSLLEKNRALSMLDNAWNTGIFPIRCRGCGELLATEFRSREYYSRLTKAGRFLGLMCPRCGFPLYDPKDIILQIGWSLLPAHKKQIELKL